MNVLVVNAGSSSLKLRLVDGDDEVAASRDLDAPGGSADDDEVADALAEMGTPDAVGHRVVHGGERTASAVVDDDLVAELDALTALAPIHQPPALAAMAATRRRLPEVPAVACFDTAFHTTLPPAATTYALPAGWRQRWGCAATASTGCPTPGPPIG